MRGQTTRRAGGRAAHARHGLRFEAMEYDHDGERRHECRGEGAELRRVVKDREGEARGGGAAALAAAGLAIKALRVVGDDLALASLVHVRSQPDRRRGRAVRVGGARACRFDEGRCAMLLDFCRVGEALVVNRAREADRVRETRVFWHLACHHRGGRARLSEHIERRGWVPNRIQKKRCGSRGRLAGSLAPLGALSAAPSPAAAAPLSAHAPSRVSSWISSASTFIGHAVMLVRK